MEADKPQTPEMTRTSFRFKLGVFFLIFNLPFGFGGAAAAGAAAVATGNKAFWTGVGVAIYASSWAMLGLGVLLAGADGKRYVKELKAKFFGRTK